MPQPHVRGLVGGHTGARPRASGSPGSTSHCLLLREDGDSEQVLARVGCSGKGRSGEQRRFPRKDPFESGTEWVMVRRRWAPLQVNSEAKGGRQGPPHGLAVFGEVGLKDLGWKKGVGVEEG